MNTAADVAQWMVAELENEPYLYQEWTILEIVERFGERFTYINERGNAALGKDVLKEFRKLTEQTVVWEKGERCWRQRRAADPIGSRGIDS
jgi:hypothetical protein